jgi:multiple sugar transport system ATP-binding protein
VSFEAHHEGMVAIAVRALSKVFDDGGPAVDNIDLDVASGEFMVLLGPSGCGKSTLLRLIAGIETPTTGEVLFDGVPVAELPARERNVAMVFQTYALYPHLTVAQNIGFPLRAAGDELDQVAARIAEAARQLGIADLLNRFPHHLSGGQRQRVAMARALVRRPSVFLLDEPMSNVDAGVRAELRIEIVSLARRLGVTTVYVTHDQSEAMSMADRVAVLRKGVLLQVGPPASVYADPATLFVATFLGTPGTSLLEAAVYAENGRVLLDLGSQALELPAGDPRTDALAKRHTERVTLALRALHLPTPSSAAMHLTGTVRRVENLGHELLAHVDTGAMPTPPPQAPAIAVVKPRRRLIPRQRTGAPATARTEYGFYPVYDPELPGDPPPVGEVIVRIPMPATLTPGTELTAAVGFDDLLLFDRSGQRIRLVDP